jgi:hypothetical protein
MADYCLILLPRTNCFNSPERASRLAAQEKGPFGRSTRRRTPSRSKTGTPSRKEDRDAAENWRVIDDIFTRAKENDLTRENGAVAVASGADTNTQPAQPIQTTPAGRPTEIIIYGFPPAFQYAAIEFYERLSQGVILEDYDRYPPHTKYDLSLSMRRSRGVTKLSKDALLKKNHYHGGEHWIKVTFDSAEAAERACYYAPHTIKGYYVHAEPYRGVGPLADEAILATPQAIESAKASPSQRSSTTLQRMTPSMSETATSATATATGTQPDINPPATPTPRSRTHIISPDPGLGSQSALATPRGTSTALQKSPQKTPRIRGAKRAILHPADKALLPAESRWRRLFSMLPLFSLFFGSGSDIIGDHVPTDENGKFDSSKASLYWLFWFWVDWLFWSDFCGLKGED